jgi:hypothetical protein
MPRAKADSQSNLFQAVRLKISRLTDEIENEVGRLDEAIYEDVFDKKVALRARKFVDRCETAVDDLNSALWDSNPPRGGR